MAKRSIRVLFNIGFNPIPVAFIVPDLLAMRLFGQLFGKFFHCLRRPEDCHSCFH